MFADFTTPELLQHGFAFLFLTGGAVFYLIGAIGMVRMPDIFTRVHAASVTDTMGIGMICIGLMIEGGLSLVTVKLIFLLLMLLFTSPFATHALVQTALHDEVEPLQGDAQKQLLKKGLDVENITAGADVHKSKD